MRGSIEGTGSRRSAQATASTQEQREADACAHGIARADVDDLDADLSIGVALLEGVARAIDLRLHVATADERRDARALAGQESIPLVDDLHVVDGVDVAPRDPE